MKSALVSFSMQVCLLHLENVVQFSILERQDALCSLNYSQFHHEFVSSLSNLSGICQVRSKF